MIHESWFSSWISKMLRADIEASLSQDLCLMISGTWFENWMTKLINMIKAVDIKTTEMFQVIYKLLIKI